MYVFNISADFRKLHCMAKRRLSRIVLVISSPMMDYIILMIGMMKILYINDLIQHGTALWLPKKYINFNCVYSII